MPPHLPTPTAPVTTAEPLPRPSDAVEMAPRAGEHAPADPGARKWGSMELGFFDRCEAISDGRALVEEPSLRAPRLLPLPRPIERLPVAAKVALAIGVAAVLAGCVIWVS